RPGELVDTSGHLTRAQVSGVAPGPSAPGTGPLVDRGGGGRGGEGRAPGGVLGDRGAFPGSWLTPRASDQRGVRDSWSPLGLGAGGRPGPCRPAGPRTSASGPGQQVDPRALGSGRSRPGPQVDLTVLGNKPETSGTAGPKAGAHRPKRETARESCSTPRGPRQSPESPGTAGRHHRASGTGPNRPRELIDPAYHRTPSAIHPGEHVETETADPRRGPECPGQLVDTACSWTRAGITRGELGDTLGPRSRPRVRPGHLVDTAGLGTVRVTRDAWSTSRASDTSQSRPGLLVDPGPSEASVRCPGEQFDTGRPWHSPSHPGELEDPRAIGYGPVAPEAGRHLGPSDPSAGLPGVLVDPEGLGPGSESHGTPGRRRGHSDPGPKELVDTAGPRPEPSRPRDVIDTPDPRARMNSPVPMVDTGVRRKRARVARGLLGSGRSRPGRQVDLTGPRKQAKDIRDCWSMAGAHRPKRETPRKAVRHRMPSAESRVTRDSWSTTRALGNWPESHKRARRPRVPSDPSSIHPGEQVETETADPRHGPECPGHAGRQRMLSDPGPNHPGELGDTSGHLTRAQVFRECWWTRGPLDPGPSHTGPLVDAEGTRTRAQLVVTTGPRERARIAQESSSTPRTIGPERDSPGRACRNRNRGPSTRARVPRDSCPVPMVDTGVRGNEPESPGDCW
ncbi:collagen alpha-2(V) chain-like, partial [Sus scrofa]|uniref:collagen alpha-2(V) chain-like n=1 Tax=Sus scrofa TaxID=9823 RepID=UPI000A2B43C8